MKALSTIIALLITLSFASCKKDELPGSDVTLTVKYDQTKPDAGARVYLFVLPNKIYDPAVIIDGQWDSYAGEMDFNYADYSGVTNGEGKVTFRNVPYGYYMMAVYTKARDTYRVKQITVGPDDKTHEYKY